MSYGIAKQECRDCGNTWNVQWGVVGTYDFGANAPKECPKCGSKDFFNPYVADAMNRWNQFAEMVKGLKLKTR